MAKKPDRAAERTPDKIRVIFKLPRPAAVISLSCRTPAPPMTGIEIRNENLAADFQYNP